MWRTIAVTGIAWFHSAGLSGRGFLACLMQRDEIELEVEAGAARRAAESRGVVAQAQVRVEQLQHLAAATLQRLRGLVVRAGRVLPYPDQRVQLGQPERVGDGQPTALRRLRIGGILDALVADRLGEADDRIVEKSDFETSLLAGLVLVAVTALRQVLAPVRRKLDRAPFRKLAEQQVLLVVEAAAGEPVIFRLGVELFHHMVVGQYEVGADQYSGAEFAAAVLDRADPIVAVRLRARCGSSASLISDLGSTAPSRAMACTAGSSTASIMAAVWPPAILQRNKPRSSPFSYLAKARDDHAHINASVDAVASKKCSTGILWSLVVDIEVKNT